MMVSRSKNHLLFLAPRRADPALAQLLAKATLRNAASTVFQTRISCRFDWRPDCPGASAFAGLCLDDVTGVFVQSLPPRIAALKPDAGTEPETGQARQRQRLLQQQQADGERDALCAALSWLEAQGRPVLNPPRGGTMLQNKAEHLWRAAELGLQIPTTLVSNHEPTRATFARRWEADGVKAGNVIVKPTRAWGAARLFSERDSAGNHGQTMQARIRGLPTRVLMLDGDVLCALSVHGSRTVDHRLDSAYAAGKAVYQSASLPGAVREALSDLCQQLGLRFAGADFILDEKRPPDDVAAWTFLELNASPIWVEQAERADVDIAGAIIDCLLRS